MYDHDDDDDEIIYVSKSEMKRDMLALQAMGERLVNLSPAELAKIPLEEELAQAIALANRIRNKHQAYRRQLQFIGKVMRKIDPEPIEIALANLDQKHQAHTYVLHQLEQWRDRLLNEGNDALTELLQHYPQIEVQPLRTLIRQANKGSEAQKTKASRELFRFLRQALEKQLSEEVNS